MNPTALLEAARRGDERAFAELTAPHRREIEAYCYRMLGSSHDAEDAVQETMLAAWRGLGGFEGRSSLRTWLYRIASNVAVRMAERAGPRLLSWERAPSLDQVDELGERLDDGRWLEPWLPRPAEPADAAIRRESVELAFVAALQQLSPNQRAVLILRDVLNFAAAEVAELLDTSTASVTSTLQRARVAVQRDAPAQPVAGDDRAVVAAFVRAFERHDVPALVQLLAQDVRFTMPPLPAWFEGRDAVAAFFERRVFATRWRQVALGDVNGHPALLWYQERDGAFRSSAVQVLHVRGGEISWIASFLDPALLDRLEHPREI